MIIVWQGSEADSYGSTGGQFIFNFTTSASFVRTSCSITRLINLSSGDKIKARARVVVGTGGISQANTVRFRIKKLISE